MSAPATVQARVKTVPEVPDRFANVLRSEWTKLWSVRSTMWAFVTFVVVTVGISVLFCLSLAASWDQIAEPERVSIEVVTLTISGLYLGQLAIITLGTLAITGEYSTGAIRTTLAAVPRRLHLLAAKALVLMAVSLAVGLATAFAAFLLGQFVLAATEPSISLSLSRPGAARIVFGASLYVMACALLGFALGALLRHTAGAITSALGIIFVLPIVGNFLPGEWGQTVTKYLNAGGAILNAGPFADDLGPWEGYAVFSLWWIVILGIAAFLIRRRDA